MGRGKGRRGRGAKGKKCAETKDVVPSLDESANPAAPGEAQAPSVPDVEAHPAPVVSPVERVPPPPTFVGTAGNKFMLQFGNRLVAFRSAIPVVEDLRSQLRRINGNNPRPSTSSAVVAGPHHRGQAVGFKSQTRDSCAVGVETSEGDLDGNENMDSYSSSSSDTEADDESSSFTRRKKPETT